MDEVKPLTPPDGFPEMSYAEAEIMLRFLAGQKADETLGPAVSEPAERSASAPLAPPVRIAPLTSDVLSALVEAVPDAVVVTNADGRIVFANAQTERLFGYQKNELLGQPIELLVPEQARDGHVAQRLDFTKEPRLRPMGKGRELSGRRKDGQEVPVEIGLSPLNTEGGALVVASVRDVSERRRAEGQLRKMEARYRTLVEGIPAVTFMAAMDDSEERELYVSPQIVDLLGFSQKEWLENPILWYTQLHPDDQARWHREFAKTVATGERFRDEYRFIARDGRVVWVRGEAQLVRDKDGRPLFLQGIAFDITGMKEVEQHLAQQVEERTREVVARAAELARSNEALNEFTYVVTHDLREPLRTMKSYLQKLAQDYQTRGEDAGNQPDSKGADYINRSMNAADRMRVLIDDLLKYSRVRSEAKEPVPVDCGQALATARANLQAAIDECAGTVTAEALPTVRADPTQLFQLFQNLLGNALKFRVEGRPPLIRVSATQDGDMWVIDVADNGIGIDPQHRQKIFLLGVESREHGRSKYPGHGIGLATCQKIVDRHGGKIWAESAGHGHGTTIRFTLPAIE